MSEVDPFLAVDPTAPQVTVEQMDELAAEIFALRMVIQDHEREQTERQKKLQEMADKAGQFMKALGRTSYASPSGTLFLQTNWTVKMPGTEPEKLQLFSWLKEKGLFEAYATVNYASLNALYKAEWEAAKERGEVEFSLPGIGEAKPLEVVRFRKASE